MTVNLAIPAEEGISSQLTAAITLGADVTGWTRVSSSLLIFSFAFFE